MRNVITLAILLLGLQVFAQDPFKNLESNLIETMQPQGVQELGLPFDHHPVMVANSWMPSLLNLGFSHDVEDEELLAKIKEEKAILRASANLRAAGETEAASVITPFMGTNFNGNAHSGFTPPDNDMAISNGGRIVSVTNSAIYYISSSGTVTYSNSFASHYSGLGFTATLFDPVVLYDPDADRFVVAVLHGSTPTSSGIVVSFSKTNNPADGWNTYYFSTSANLKSGVWFDYPKIGVNDNEVFISGNLFLPSGGGFDEAIIIQIDKNDGYTGGSLTFDNWLGMTGFTVTPLRMGQNISYGPVMWFAHTSSGGNNRVFLKVITNKLGASATMNSYFSTVPSYSPAADANQQGTSQRLENGDSRVLSGFWLNDVAHFVFMSDVSSGWNGIYYCRTNTNTLVTTTSTFGNPGTSDYSYPAIASFTTSSTDPAAAIVFQASGSTSFPSVRLTAVDAGLNWSGSINIAAGTGFVDILSGSTERWGDYIGISRKHNASSRTVWVAGGYGNTSNTYNTHIAEVGGIFSDVKDVQPPKIVANVFPNPVKGLFELEFELDDRVTLNIDIVDINGKVVKTLYHGKGKPGTNRFTFNKGALSTGIYLLNITDGKRTYANERIVIAD